MKRHELKDYVVQEVDDLLGAGSVGLYEFVDSLRDQPGLTESDMRVIAAEALTHMLDRGLVQLEWERWGDVDFAEDATGVIPSARDWETPTDEPYLAVIPV